MSKISVPPCPHPYRIWANTLPATPSCKTSNLLNPFAIAIKISTINFGRVPFAIAIAILTN